MADRQVQLCPVRGTPCHDGIAPRQRAAGWRSAPITLGARPSRRAQLFLADPPIAPEARNTCDIAATDHAIYELANQRCSIWYGEGTSGEIRRIVNPSFRPAQG